MLCRLAILFMLCSPLAAVDAPLALEGLRLNVEVAADTVNVTTRASLRNTGEAGSFTLRQPAAVSESLLVAGEALAQESPGTWVLTLEADQQLEVSWTAAIAPTHLPHLHPQGLRRVRVPLAHMRGCTALPEFIEVSLTHEGLPAELFDGRVPGRVAVTGRMADVQLDWLATTLSGRTSEVAAMLDATDERRRTHDNRAYTSALVDMADLQALAGDQAGLAATCESLAALEAAAGHTIAHCGPWARWRRHIPWTLRRMAALEAQGLEGATAAGAARTAVAPVWGAYIKARERARRFDGFDFLRYGSFWDYDWDTTRELYARALEVLGDPAAAKAVRETQ